VLEEAVNSVNGGFDTQTKGYLAELNLNAPTAESKQEKERLFDELKRIRQRDQRLQGQKRANQINELQKKRADN